MVKKLKIAFLHKALLYGGAERLILDMALALKDQGHQITIYTAEFDAARTFSEFSDPSINVKVRIDNHIESRRLGTS
jgi:alpha-1,3/alpha-1,6-mannosyltransferase